MFPMPSQRYSYVFSAVASAELKSEGNLRSAILVVTKMRLPENIMLETILLVVLVLLVVGALPSWGHSRNWGYGPSGALGVVLVVLLVLLVAGRV